MTAETQIQWNRAVRLANEELDTRELVALLKSDAEITPTIRKLLADLFDRHSIGRKRGNQKLPINRRSLTEIKMASAVAEVKRLRAAGIQEDDAVNAVSDVWKLVAANLTSALHGKRGASRRFAKRSAAPK